MKNLQMKKRNGLKEIMMINRLFILLIGIAFVGCSTDGNTKLEEDIYEKEILGCVYSNYNNLGCDLEKELKSFENYLIENGVLHDSSSKSYYDCYVGIAATRKLPPTAGVYELDSLILNNISLYSGCYNSFSDDKSVEFRKSRYGEYLASMKTVKVQNQHPYTIITTALATSVDSTSIDSNSFDLLFYRIPLLMSFYSFEVEAIEIRKFNSLPNIDIIFHANADIFINGNKIEVDELESVITESIEAFTDEEKEIFVFRLGAESETKMKFIVPVRDFIKSISTNKLSFRTLKDEDAK